MRWLITGGVGFIGTNLSEYLIAFGDDVTVIDDLSRAGVEKNAQYLLENFGLSPVVLDITNRESLRDFLVNQVPFDAIAHLAGQVSLLESLRNPCRDLEVNLIGTVNLLEFVRTHSPETAIIGMSSNKVYGDLSWIDTQETERRYVAPGWPEGFDESLPVDPHGPYGCSKSAADQYLADYAQSFGLRTASLRQSSVYGRHQHPRSDQGWVAHLVEEALAGREISLNGVGKQVRDLLHAEDLARLIRLLGERVSVGERNQFNVGGGPHNSLSILELFDWLRVNADCEVRWTCGDRRPGDQNVFVADTSLVRRRTGWSPTIGVAEGLAMLIERYAR